MPASTYPDRKDALRERTKRLASSIIRLFTQLDSRREEVRIVGRQLLRSGTSVAANYREASRARSASEFIAKVELCAQEADETQLWLELLKADCKVASEIIDPVWQELDELIAIFVTMAKKTKQARREGSRES